MTAHQVRQYRRDDAPACCDIITRCLPLMSGLNDAARRFLVSKNQPATLHTELASLFTLVVESNGFVVGVGALDEDEMKRVYVDPTYQGNGCGQALLQHLEAEASRRGTRKVWADASPNAEQFYTRLGYTPHQQERLTIGEATFDFVRMSKGLREHE